MVNRDTIVYVGEKFVDQLSPTLGSNTLRLSVYPPSESDIVLDRLPNTNGAIACLVCEHHPPDVDAIEFLRTCSQITSSVPRVLLTDDGSESLASDAVTVDVSEYVNVGKNGTTWADVGTTIESNAAGNENDDTDVEPETPYRDLIEQNIAGVYEIRDGKFTYVNTKFADILGYTQEELVGTPPLEVLAERDHQSLQENMEQLARGEAESVFTEHHGVCKDGSEVVLEAHGQLAEQDPEPVFHGVVRDITEEKQRERRFEAIFANTYQFTGLMDPDGTILEANQPALSFLGLTREDVVGTKLWDLDVFDSNEAAKATVREAVDTAKDGEQFRDELRVQGPDRVLVLDFSVRPVTDDQGAVTLLIPEGHDVTERKQRERRASGLNDLLTEFIGAETKQQVSDTVVEFAADQLDIPVAMVALVDEDERGLSVAAESQTARDHLDETSLVDKDGGIAWEAFVSGDQATVEEFESALPGSSATVERPSVHPLGRHGVFVVGSALPDDEFVETLVESVRRTLDRVEREAILQEREDALEDRNKKLDRLNRLNRVIRKIDQVLVGASTRAEIEKAVCEKLVETESYRFAWIGRSEAASGQITPREWAGDEQGYLEAASFSTEAGTIDQSPTGRAVQSREPQVMETTLTDPPREEWREAALRRGFRSCIAIPLVYRDSLYGVLTLFADQSELFGTLEREVLTELGETIAYAINAVESKKSLVSDSIVEVELRADVSAHPLMEFLERDSDREFEFEGVVPADDGTFRVFYTVRGATAESVSSFMRGMVGIKEIRVITDHEDECLFECTVNEASLVYWLLDRGAVPRSITIGQDGGRVRVELSSDVDIREFVEQFKSEYPNSELVATRERERAVRTKGDFQSVLDDSLTARQREVLRTAYLSGYFECPRERSGKDVADSLGISSSTFSNHVRAGLRNLFGVLYTDERLQGERTGQRRSQ